MVVSQEQKLKSYEERLRRLIQKKLQQTMEKQKRGVLVNIDDDGSVLLPEDHKIELESNHPDGSFYGPEICGKNFKEYLEQLPVYIDPDNSLAGAIFYPHFDRLRWPKQEYVERNIEKYGFTREELEKEIGKLHEFVKWSVYAYKKEFKVVPMGWNPDISYSHLHEYIKKYSILQPIGATQHFTPDLELGLKLGWGGILDKIKRYEKENRGKSEFYKGLRYVVEGIQDYIRRHAEAALEMARQMDDPILRENLEEIAKINMKLVNEPPTTFREACQWIAWYQIFARMYNRSGALSRLDKVLQPYYEKDIRAGRLTREEAIFHLACLLLKDTPYQQIGELCEDGVVRSNEVSYLIVEAAYRLGIPQNIGICVGEKMDEDHERLFDRVVEILLETKKSMFKFVGIDNVVKGFMKNGYPFELARQRVYSGCHWFNIPGREYTLNDIAKLNLARIFEVAFYDMMSDPTATPSIEELWVRFRKHLKIAIEVVVQCFQFHFKHMHEVFPELVLDLLCYGPIEKGMDASELGSLEFYNMCIDAAGLATVADSFAAIEERIEREKRLTYRQLKEVLERNFDGAEAIRILLASTPKFGSGRSTADKWAKKIAELFTELVKEQERCINFKLIPGLFSWMNYISMGERVGALPNGRKAHEPLSKDVNPDFEAKGLSLTQISNAVASVQPGYGNAAPLYIGAFDPGPKEKLQETKEALKALIRGHFKQGGTLININIVDKEIIIEAHKDPSKYPDLIVRPTGFSVYFASLSKEYREAIVKMIMEREQL